MAFFDIAIILVSIFLVMGGLVWFIIYSIIKKRNEKTGAGIKFDFTTKHGIRIKLSPLTKDITSSQIEQWTDDLVQFWSSVKGWDKNSLYEKISNTYIIIYDSVFIKRQGAEYNGLAYVVTSGKIEITSLYKPELDQTKYTPLRKVQSLFRHEESHMLVYHMDPSYPIHKHHDLFSEVKLGA